MALERNFISPRRRNADNARQNRLRRLAIEQLRHQSENAHFEQERFEAQREISRRERNGQ